MVVLSNNDGCVIARSNEAKALGIRMGAPWFQIRHLEQQAKLVALSANFTLYGDMSHRLMTLSAGLGPDQEVYSIDEAFIGMQGVPGDLTRRARAMRARIWQWIGIPCGIGLGTTKTLAKLANHIAKTAERKPGLYPAELAQVCNLAALPASDLEALMAMTDVGDVWGVGPRLAQQLQPLGVSTALDLARLPATSVRRRWGVVLERTVRELQGQACLALDDMGAPRQHIVCARSFGQPVTELHHLQEAVSEFVSRAAEKLRSQGSLAGQVRVFARTSPFRPGPRFADSVVVPLQPPVADTTILVDAACRAVTALYRPGFSFLKAGVMLLDLIPADQMPRDLLMPATEHRARDLLMTVMDDLNQRFGKGCLHVASTGATQMHRLWDMKQARLTPSYTTRWDDVPVAKA